MALRYNHTHGCQTCGAHPDNPRNKTQKLWGCRECKSFTCTRCLAKPRACPRCGSKRLYVAVRYQSQSMKNKGGTGEVKKGLFSGGGGGGGASPQSQERAQKAAHVATEIVKGIGSGVAEAMKILSEKDSRANMPRPEDGVGVDDLHGSSYMSDGLNKEMFDDRAAEEKKSSDIGLIEAEDPLFRLTVLAENTLDNDSFLAIPNKKPNYTVDSYLFAPSLYEAELISTELAAYNAKNDQKMICLLALHVDPTSPEVGESFNRLLAENSFLFGSIAVSPKLAGTVSLEETDAHLTDLLNAQEKIIALGATGYDLHYNAHTEEEQGALLALHAEIAGDFELPLFLEHKNAEGTLKAFIQSTEQTVILTQPIFSEIETAAGAPVQRVITVDIQNEDQHSTYQDILKKEKKSKVLLGSGHRLTALKDHPRNKSALTLETLKAYCEVSGQTKPYSAQHQFNGNFLKTFHPDL